MSYSVQCQVCDHRLPVDDPSSPPVECPECGSFYSLLPTTDRPPIYVPRVLRELGFDPTAPPPRPAEVPNRPKRTLVRSDSPLAVLEPAVEHEPLPRRQPPPVSPGAAPKPVNPIA